MLETVLQVMLWIWLLGMFGVSGIVLSIVGIAIYDCIAERRQAKRRASR